MLIVSCITFCLLVTLIRPIRFQGEITSDGPGSNEIFSISSDTPVVITSDADFTNQGWPGTGSLSTPFVIEDLIIKSNQTCISISNTLSNFVIRNCTLTNLGANTKVIELTNVRNGSILSNNITFNLIGIDLLSCGSSVIENNTLQRPDIAYESGVHAIRLYGSDYVEISRNFIRGRPFITGSSSIGGILLNLSTDCTVNGNSINSFKGRGVYLENSGYCIVTNNWVDDCLNGFYIRASNDCFIENNIATRTHMGFGVWVGINHILNGNRAEKNLGEGFIIANSYDCELIGNIVRDVSENHNGIELIYGAADNILYVNFILCDNVLDEGSNNAWDNGGDLGNYWTSYDGSGTYPIPGAAGSVDRFPRQYIIPAINLVSITNFEFGLESRVLNWTYTGQAPISYTLERQDDSQFYHLENEGKWPASLPTLSLYLEHMDVGEYPYRFTVFYADGFSQTEYTIVYIEVPSGPDITLFQDDLYYPNRDGEIRVQAYIEDNSGVSKAILAYNTSFDEEWRNVTMVRNQIELWTAMVPLLADGTSIFVKVYASDTLGNWAVSDIITRKFLTEYYPPPNTTSLTPTTRDQLYWVGFASGSIIVVVIGILYLNQRDRRIEKGF